jgi:tetratricopeptide (TPR) repeat protein
LFLGTVVKTLEQTFSHIYVISEDEARSLPRGSFVAIAATREINLENLTQQKPLAGRNLWILNDSEIETYIRKGRGIVLTDDYAPVENMLTPVVRQSAETFLLSKYLEQIRELGIQGKMDESIAVYKEIIKADPTKSVKAYDRMVQILAGQGKWQEVFDAAKSAIEYNERAKVKDSVSDIYYYAGLASKNLGRNNEASEYLHKAIRGYREDSAKNPGSTRTLIDLGNALAETGQFGEATQYFQQAIDINPLETESRIMLASALFAQQRYDDAIAALKKAIASFSNAGNEKAVAELQRHLQFIEEKNKNN